MDLRILHIDLNEKTYRVEDISPSLIEKFMGGRGLGAYLLYTNTQKGIEPLAPDNPLIFTAGLAQGLSTPFSPKLALNTKSPLTHCYLFSITSGKLGHNLRKSGYFSLKIVGKLDEPHYLVINNGKVEFHRAVHLWGKNTREAQEIMLKEVGGKKGDAAVIGPAGEELLPIAGIFNESEYLRCFGRGGCGAVMGSKMLKGLVILGEGKVLPGNPEKFIAVKRQVLQTLKKEKTWAEFRRAYGTGADMDVMNEHGIIPTKNWQGGVFPEVEKMCTKTQGWPRQNVVCGPHCPAPCAHLITIGMVRTRVPIVKVLSMKPFMPSVPNVVAVVSMQWFMPAKFAMNTASIPCRQEWPSVLPWSVSKGDLLPKETQRVLPYGLVMMRP